jgi:hypothetical protein
LYSKTNDIAYKFGRLTEILPEVFEADISSELESRKLEFGRLFDEDLKSVKQLLKNNNLTIEIKHFQESDACVISKRFLIIDQTVERKSELVKFFLSGLFMCKSTILYLIDLMIRESHDVKKSFTDYWNSLPKENEKNVYIL